MRYFCTDCGRYMPHLETPGWDINRELICPDCAEKVWRQVRIELLCQLLQEHFQQIP